MRKNLTKHGNSLALVIEKPILELLGADADTPFEIATDGQKLVLSPVLSENRREAFLEALESTNRRYAGTLKNLAKAPVSLRERPAFGMWKDRVDMEDPAEYVRELRKGRFGDL